MFKNDDLGRLVLTADAVDQYSSFRAGLAFNAAGALHAILAADASAPYYYVNGVKVTATGQVVVAEDTPTAWNRGWPTTGDGVVCIHAEVVPPAASFYHNGAVQDFEGVYTSGFSAAWSPLELFASSEVGVWYDPSDLSTMFQDSAGTTPVTAVGQSVGLILDKSKGLVLGSESVPDNGFDTPASWTPQDANWTVSGGKATYSDISLSYLQSVADITLTGGKWYRATFELSGGTPHVAMAILSLFDKTASVNLWSAYQTFTTNGVYTVHFYVASTVTGIRIYGNNSSSSTWALEYFSIKEIPGNHATQATAASRPVLRQTAGGLYYLEFDGTDDFLVTSTIDFTATDKMSVFAGVTKNTDSGSGMAIELSVGNSVGSFYLLAPAAGANYQFAATRTTTSGFTLTTFTSPITNVLSVNYDFAGAVRADEIKPRANAQIPTLTGIGSADCGNGNFGNFPLYLGRRNGASLPFNGHIYSVVVRGALSDATQITNAETYVAGKTGVTL